MREYEMNYEQVTCPFCHKRLPVIVDRDLNGKPFEFDEDSFTAHLLGLLDAKDRRIAALENLVRDRQGFNQGHGEKDNGMRQGGMWRNIMGPKHEDKQKRAVL